MFTRPRQNDLNHGQTATIYYCPRDNITDERGCEGAWTQGRGLILWSGSAIHPSVKILHLIKSNSRTLPVVVTSHEVYVSRRDSLNLAVATTNGICCQRNSLTSILSRCRGRRWPEMLLDLGNRSVGRCRLSTVSLQSSSDCI